MNLWTYHDPDFSLTSGRVDHTRSPYADDPAIMAAYLELGRRLNIPDVQIIWCYTRHGRYPLTSIERREWHLSVPSDQIRACYNQLAWNSGSKTEIGDYNRLGEYEYGRSSQPG